MKVSGSLNNTLGKLYLYLPKAESVMNIKSKTEIINCQKM